MTAMDKTYTAKMSYLKPFLRFKVYNRIKILSKNYPRLIILNYNIYLEPIIYFNNNKAKRVLNNIGKFIERYQDC